MRKRLLLFNLIFSLFLTAIIFAESRIPTGNNWLSSASTTGSGDRDQINVIFFEVPDDITSTLYFALHHPGIDTTNVDYGAALPYPMDQVNTAPAGVGQGTQFTLVGGAGAISHAESRLINYTTEDPYRGTQLGQMVFWQSGDTDWVYFPGVDPTQGEHIGNKYYFKVVVEVLGANYKNSYQMDVSLINSGDPSQITEINAFSYSWNIALLKGSPAPFKIYPFIPEGTTGQRVVVSAYDYDQADTNPTDDISITVRNYDDVSVLGSYSPAYVTVDNWEYTITGSDESKTINVESYSGSAINHVNTSEFYSWLSPGAVANDVLPTTEEILRSYSSHVIAGTADHLAVSVEDGIAISGGTDTETITMQVVDSSGNPQPYPKRVFIDLSSSSAVIKAINGTAATTFLDSDNLFTGTAQKGYLDTDSLGMVTFAISNIATESVSFTIETDGELSGTGDDTTEWIAPGTHDSVSIDFQANPEPTMSSASNTSFTEGNVLTVGLPDITITEVGPTSITTAQDVYIRIPVESQSDVDFVDIASTTPTITGTVGGTVDTVNSTTEYLIITPSGNLSNGDTIIIQGLEIETGASKTSFNLEMSYDGGSTYSVIDDKIIKILDSNATWIWRGDTSTSWNNQANWDSGDGSPGDDGVPGVAGNAGVNVIIPDVTNDPILDVTAAVNELSITGNLTLNQQLTVSSDLTVSGSITGGANNFRLAGNADFTGGIYTKGAGIIVFNGGVSQTLTPNGNDLGHIQINTGSTDVSVVGVADFDDVNIAAATANLTLGGNTTVGGDWTNVGSFISNGYTVTFDGTGSQTIDTGGTAATQDFDNLIFNGTGDFTIGSVDSQDLAVLNSLTVTNSTGVTFSTAVTVPTIVLTNTTGTISFAGDLTVSTVFPQRRMVTMFPLPALRTALPIQPVLPTQGL